MTRPQLAEEPSWECDGQEQADRQLVVTAAQVAVVWGAVAAGNIVDIHLALCGLVRAKVKGQFHENV